jgi:hypothetical protein
MRINFSNFQIMWKICLFMILKKNLEWTVFMYKSKWWQGSFSWFYIYFFNLTNNKQNTSIYIINSVKWNIKYYGDTYEVLVNLFKEMWSKFKMKNFDLKQVYIYMYLKTNYLLN